MTVLAFTAEEWDRFNAMPLPAEVFTMTCPEGHETPWSHWSWHVLDRGRCKATGCPAEIDFAHARRHVDCPCDETPTAPTPADLTAPALRPGDTGYRFPTFIR